MGHEQDFEVYQGDQQLQEFEIAFATTLPQSATQYVIGGATDHFYHAMEDRYDEFVEIVKNKKLITNYIGTGGGIERDEESQRSASGLYIPNN